MLGCLVVVGVAFTIWRAMKCSNAVNMLDNYCDPILVACHEFWMPEEVFASNDNDKSGSFLPVFFLSQRSRIKYMIKYIVCWLVCWERRHVSADAEIVAVVDAGTLGRCRGERRVCESA